MEAILAEHDDSGVGGWIGQAVDMARLSHVGLKVAGGGPHQSKTMMLKELSTVMAVGGQSDQVDAILRQNILGKPSIQGVQAACGYRW